MRVARTIEDCNTLFRELYGKLDSLNSQDFNLKKKRVVNASPSKDNYDYVVRKELLDLVGQGTSQTVRQQSGLYAIVFSNEKNIEVGEYGTSPYIFKRKSIPIIACVSAVTPPTSDSARFNFKHNTADLLTEALVLPSTATVLEVVSSTAFSESVGSFEIDDTLVLNILSAADVAKVTVELLVREV